MSDRPNPAQLLRSFLPHFIAVALLAGGGRLLLFEIV